MHSQQNAASKNTSNSKPPKPPLLLISKPSYPLRHSHWSPTRPHGSEADTATPDSGVTSPFPILSRARPDTVHAITTTPQDRIPRRSSSNQHRNIQGYYSSRKRALSDACTRRAQLRYRFRTDRGIDVHNVSHDPGPTPLCPAWPRAMEVLARIPLLPAF